MFLSCLMRKIPVVDARLTARDAARAAAQARAAGSAVGALAGSSVFADLQGRILELLSSATPCCVLRGTRFLELPAADRQPYVATLALLLGVVSDSNVFSERSGAFVDEVRPSDPASKDVTFQLGACEAHADESSKERPEDVVALWCVRPAGWGGSSLLWLTPDVTAGIAEQHAGDDLIEVLRRPDFLFGGKLRQPPRILKAPILFGKDGVRYRLGTIQDAAEVTNRPLRDDQQAAIRALTIATRTVLPYQHPLAAGEALVWMNRRALHSRTDFDDRHRLLYRTRCFNDQLTNRADDQVEWLSGCDG